MSQSGFIKRNFVLIVGLTLPVLLMLGFIVASTLPATIADPPQYDLVFSVQDYRGTANIPVTVNFVVKEGVLKAQYAQIKPMSQGYYNSYWRKLYLYEARTRTIRELAFGLPLDLDKIEGIKEEAVEATKEMKLDTRVQAPDGYELSYGNHNRGGLFGDIFWGWSNYSNEVYLRKGLSSVKLATGDDRYRFYAGSIDFSGWVIGKNGHEQ